MRLRNRIVKAGFWTDGKLLRWPRDKRFFYMSLWALAEDSCCIEDDPFEWKYAAFPSPLDADITIEMLTAWRDELIEAGKLVPYEVEGQRYFYLSDMARHEHPRNPQSPDLPLPAWVTCRIQGQGKGRRVSFEHEPVNRCDRVQTSGGHRGQSVESARGDRSASPALPCPVLPCSALPGPGVDAPAREDESRGDLAIVGAAYERSTGHTVDQAVFALCREHPTDRLLEAIRRATVAGKTSTAYIGAVAQGLVRDRWKPEPVIVSEPDAYDAL